MKKIVKSRNEKFEYNKHKISTHQNYFCLPISRGSAVFPEGFFGNLIFRELKLSGLIFRTNINFFFYSRKVLQSRTLCIKNWQSISKMISSIQLFFVLFWSIHLSLRSTQVTIVRSTRETGDIYRQSPIFSLVTKNTF